MNLNPEIGVKVAGVGHRTPPPPPSSHIPTFLYTSPEQIKTGKVTHADNLLGYPSIALTQNGIDRNGSAMATNFVTRLYQGQRPNVLSPNILHRAPT